MCAQKVTTALAIICISSFFVNCGELDTVLPSTGTYKVNARVNDISLDDCSLINAKDRIYPYFASSAAGDPDLTGLAVFLQTPSGQGAGKKIRYTLKTEVKGQTDRQMPEQTSAEGTEKPPANGGQTGTQKPEAEPELDSDQDADTEDRTDGNLRTGQKTGSTAPAASALQEAIQMAADVQDAETETLILVSRLDRDLPFFVLPEKLEIGPYVMVFQVLGKKEVLYREAKTVYYLGNAHFSLIDVQQYLPDVSGSHLVPPGTTVMLEAQVVSDTRLAPYVVWYNGKRRIGEGSLADGGAFLLWKAPEQNGFYTIRAEIFPQRPVEGLYGKFREISLPVSAKAAGAGYFSGEADRITHWYRFQGNLRDSKAPGDVNRALTSQTQMLPLWMPEDTVYGLKVGAGDVYGLSSVSFVSEDPSSREKQETGRFMLRFKPAGEGTVFSAYFEAADPAGRVYLDLNCSEKDLSLNISGPGESASAALAPGLKDEDGFISLYIDFTVHDKFFEAGFGRENGEAVSAALKEVALSGPLTGAGSFQFGASLKPSDTKKPAAGLLAEKQASPHMAVLDEFALAFREKFPAGEEPEVKVEPEGKDENETPALTGAAAPPPEEEPPLKPASSNREPNDRREENAAPPPEANPDLDDVSQKPAISEDKTVPAQEPKSL
ncbi:MAG: hypothetical protein LBP23_07605 [Treponema sp.]|nr:hypothetical protein [Treponema sp.]